MPEAGYRSPGSRLTLACSCDATVVVSLMLVGVHRHYTVQITARGDRCRILHHRRGARTVVRTERHGSRVVWRDVLGSR
jgi:hypothetical protein